MLEKEVNMAVSLFSFSTPNNSYVYDRGTNSLLSALTKDEFLACRRVETGEETEDDWKILNRLTEAGYLKESRLKTIRHSSTSYMRHQLESRIKQLTIQVTRDCNLRCSYCAYSGKYNNQRQHESITMPLELMLKCIDFAMARSHGLKEVIIAFYGGEPLLGINKIKSCVEHIKNKYRGRKVRYSMTTNGTIFDDDTITFLAENDFLINISFDGPRELHNLNRVFENGEGSYDIIMKNVKYIKEKYPDFYRKISFLTTIAPGVDLACVDHFYTAETVLAENYANVNTLTSFSSKEDIYYGDEFSITSNFQYMKVLLAEIGLYSNEKVSKLFKSRLGTLALLQRHLSKTMLTETAHPGGPCLPGIDRPFVDVYGNILPCERVSEDSNANRIGHIDTGFDLDKVESVLNVGKLTEEECLKCWNFINCGLCIAACDGEEELTRESRLRYCDGAKFDTYSNLRTICMLTENGYDFKTQTFKKVRTAPDNPHSSCNNATEADKRDLKQQLLTAINTIVPLTDYNKDDYIFSNAYPLSSTDMVYLIIQLSKDLAFTITDDFIDAMEMCTFCEFEALLAKYSK